MGWKEWWFWNKDFVWDMAMLVFYLTILIFFIAIMYKIIIGSIETFFECVPSNQSSFGTICRLRVS